MTKLAAMAVVAGEVVSKPLNINVCKNKMWIYVFYVLASVLAVYLVHSAYYAILNANSTKKTKDIVQIYTAKYQNIINDLLTQTGENKPNTAPNLVDLVHQLSLE